MNMEAKESLTDLPVYASVRCITGKFEPPILGVLRTVQWSMYRRHMHSALIKSPGSWDSALAGYFVVECHNVARTSFSSNLFR